MKRLLLLEPVLAANLAAAALAVAVAFGLPISGEQRAALVGIVVPALAILGAATRHVVTPVVTAAANITDAAAEAATSVAEQLTETTAGAVGQVTAVGKGIVSRVVEDVTAAVLERKPA